MLEKMMGKGKTHTEKTTAESKSIGFDFQYYYFLRRLLNIKYGESVGIEVKDDVHTDLSNDRQLLVQVKHTVQKKSDGKAKNLTVLDEDLWKTIYNWAMVIADKEAGRSDEIDQLCFVEKTDFLLATNKSENEKNRVLTLFRDFKVGVKSLGDVKDVLQELKEQTASNTIEEYVLFFLGMSDSVLEVFIKNIEFELEIVDIIDQCKLSIMEKMIDKKDVDAVFSSLDSQIRLDNFIVVSSGAKFIVSFDDFHKKYRRHFDIARNKDLTILPFMGALPDELESQIFIKQLIDINDVDVQEIDIIADYTRIKLGLNNNIEYWLEEGELTRSEIEDFDNEAKARWKNRFRSAYRMRPNDGEMTNKAINLIDGVRSEQLSISSQLIGSELSNGEFYRLSDIPKIGWHIDWEDKYK